MTLLTHTHRFNKEKIDTVSARILETNTKYNLKNQICTFSDPDFHDILFMKTGGTSLHFGSIYSIEKSNQKGWQSPAFLAARPRAFRFFLRLSSKKAACLMTG